MSSPTLGTKSPRENESGVSLPSKVNSLRNHIKTSFSSIFGSNKSKMKIAPNLPIANCPLNLLSDESIQVRANTVKNYDEPQI